MNAVILLAVLAVADFDIPAGRADQMIVEWSRQAHIQVLFEMSVVLPWNTLAVKGRSDPLVALLAMLRLTELKAEYTTPRSVAVFETHYYCHPEWGAAAPLPPCEQMPMEIHAPATML